MKMKVTNRCARKDKAGKHNDRNFNLVNAPHIDQSKVNQNKYWTYNGDQEHSFAEVEKEFYARHFTDFIDVQNKKNSESRHKDRNKTLDSYYHGARTRPEDQLLQIGDKNNHATPEELWECAMTYMERFDQIYGDKCKILDMALHLDETTPHVHIRRVWIAEDEYGNECVNQQKALEQLGITPPDPEGPIGKYNNQKMTFTQSDINLFQNICIEKGLDIDIVPEEKRKHLSLLEYKKREISKDIEGLEREKKIIATEIEKAKEELQELDQTLDKMLDFFEENEIFRTQYAQELEEVKKRSQAEKFVILAEIYNQEIKYVLSDNDFSAAISRAEIAPELVKMKKFIEQEGLMDKYKQSSSIDKEYRYINTGDKPSSTYGGNNYF